MARRRLPLSDTAKAHVLEHLETCRKSMIAVIASAPINGPEANAASAVTVAIDDFAGILTGDREHFWGKDRPGDAPKTT